MTGLLPGRTAQLRSWVAASAGALVHPPARDRALVFGPDPIRISIAGSGLAVGFGVEHRDHALDGRVAVLVHAATGRGVATTNRAAGRSRLADQLLEAAMSGGFEDEDVLIWAPSLLQVGGRATAWQWRRQLGRLLAAAPGCRRTIVLQLPVLTGDAPIVAVAAPIIDRINLALAAAAAEHERVAVVAVPPLPVPPVGRPLLSGPYYAAAAPAVAAAITEGMDPARRRCRIGRATSTTGVLSRS